MQYIYSLVNPSNHSVPLAYSNKHLSDVNSSGVYTDSDNQIDTMEKNWSFFHKITFLFFFIYLILYTNSVHFLFSILIEPFWQKVIPWFANFCSFETPITIFTNGSGDTTYNYFQVLFFIITALILSLGISIYDRKRKNYLYLKEWLIILVRFYLASLMVTYGLGKLFYLQMPFPGVIRLQQELGDFSPMGLLWAFMGYSKGYSMFTGALEIIGGLLLLSRKTLTLGALTTFSVMLNVMMLNYCYDVPVKLLSTHMVLMAFFLIAMDRKRLINFFLRNEPIAIRSKVEVIPEKLSKAKTIIKWIAIVVYLGHSLYQVNELKKGMDPVTSNPFFYGQYAVEIFQRIPLTNIDSSTTSIELANWKTFFQDRDGYAMVKTDESQKIWYEIKLDSLNSKVNLKRNGESDYQKLRYDKLNNDRFYLHGKYGSDSIRILMMKEDISKRTLVQRDFHWINEYPYHR